MKVALAVANAIFANCNIEIQLAGFDDMGKSKDYDALVLALNFHTTAERRITFFARLIAEAAKKQGAHIGILVTDLSFFGVTKGVIAAQPAHKGKASKDDEVLRIGPGGFIGGILISEQLATVLTLAQEIRDRLAHEDVGGSGDKLRFGNTADLIKEYPDAKLGTLCDDETKKLIAGLKSLGISAVGVHSTRRMERAESSRSSLG